MRLLFNLFIGIVYLVGVGVGSDWDMSKVTKHMIFYAMGSIGAQVIIALMEA